MAQVLAAYQKQERLSDQALIAHLNTTSKMLTRLALCKKPDPNSSEFANQIRQIASYTEIEVAQIASIVRQVESLQKLAERSEPNVPQDTTAHQPQLRKGLLAAARDRTEAEADQPPPPEEDEKDISED
ncbi:MAG: hypothetical protein HS126_37380 [Anaerolineales bacterium]|nr:hypothetical protein [Anaerolineales bacterium]